MKNIRYGKFPLLQRLSHHITMLPWCSFLKAETLKIAPTDPFLSFDGAGHLSNLLCSGFCSSRQPCDMQSLLLHELLLFFTEL